MKAAFINIALRPDSPRRRLPVGLGFILTALQKADYEFDLIDMEIDRLDMQQLEQILSKTQYDVYGFGCIITGFKWVMQISSLIKRINPAAIIIAGNSVATSIPEILLNHTKVDIAVLGEGDITITELFNALEHKKDLSLIAGIAFKQDEKIIYTKKRAIIKNVDSLGFPEWDIFQLDKYYEFGRVNANVFTVDDDITSFPLNSARGCPYNCTFCYHVFKGEIYRKYSEDAIVGEMKRLHDKYGCNYISFWDELTFVNDKSVEDMIARLSQLNFKINWDAVSRGDLFRKEHVGLIKEMRNLGAENIAFSLENASPEILKAMKKKLSVKRVIEQSHALWEGGVTPLTSIIFGYPQETPETIELTLKVCEECNIYPSVGFLLPLPGTDMYDWAIKNGFIKDEVEYFLKIADRQDLHVNLTSMTDNQFTETVTEKLEALAKKQGLQLDSVLKTVTYQRPKK